MKEKYYIIMSLTTSNSQLVMNSRIPNEEPADVSPVAAPGFKKWGGKKGATIDYGGANMCA